jgi:hypothetical protein
VLLAALELFGCTGQRFIHAFSRHFGAPGGGGRLFLLLVEDDFALEIRSTGGLGDLIRGLGRHRFGGNLDNLFVEELEISDAVEFCARLAGCRDLSCFCGRARLCHGAARGLGRTSVADCGVARALPIDGDAIKQVLEL